MPIQVSCSCGKSFRANDEWAGRRAKCPSCGQPLEIPAAQPAADAGLGDLLSEAGMASKTGKSCPSCGNEVSDEAVLCIQCGFDFRTGKQKQMVDGSGLKVGSSETDKLLARAAQEIEENPIKEDEGYGTALGAWLMTAILAFGLAVGVLLLYAGFKWVDNAPDPNQRAAVVMAVCGWMFMLVGRLWIIILGFRQSVLQGVLVWFVPCYDLFFVFGNFSDAMVPFILSVVGGTMWGVAQAMLAM